jgi:hypothetical protein
MATTNLPVPMRTAAASLAGSGLIVAAATPWHPSIFARPVDEVVRDFGAWTPLHLLAIVAVILAVPGAAGIVAAHNGSLGRLGQTGLLVTFVGVVLTASLAAIEAVVFPILARSAPDLLALNGPLLRSPSFITIGALAACWPLGLALLGLAALKSGLFPKVPAMLLTLSGPLFLALEGPFVPLLGVLSAVAFGVAQLWWAVLLRRSTGDHDQAAP